MENIELWIIGILFATTAISLIMLKESKYFSKYWKDLYFIQKELNDKFKKASEGNPSNSENANCAIFDVSGSLLIPDVHIEKNLILARAINYIADDVQEDRNKLAKEIAEGLITLLDKQ